MARVAREVAARVAQQADRKRLQGYAENLERQVSGMLQSADLETGRGSGRPQSRHGTRPPSAWFYRR
jgi:hypothetical protein